MKFRVRRSAPDNAAERLAAAKEAAARAAAAPASARVFGGGSRAVGAPAFDAATAFDSTDDGFGDESFPTAARNANVAPPEEVSAEAEIDSIRREGLTGRQLRMARRVAQKYNLAPTSDFDAVRLLRKRGVDPFERSTMLELVIADGKPAQPPAEGQSRALTTTQPKLPQTVDRAPPPSTRVMTPDARAAEIKKIQRDIARRRQRKTMMLFLRLAALVVLPTIIAGYYYYNIATPLYATKSQFVIQKADAPAGGLASLFSGTQFAASQDSITVQSYLQSRDAMLRLDKEAGFRAHFSQDWIDPIERLPKDASMEEAYKLYKSHVQIGFDPSEGLIKMEVMAADPQTSAKFSNALITYAEEQVDQLSHRLREDQMQGAMDSYNDAEAKMQAAQAKVLDLQEKLGVLDPTAESGSVMGQITTFETQLQKKTLELQQLKDNPRPNQARVDGVQGDIDRLQALISKLRAQLTETKGDNASLARITGELRMAETDLSTRQAMMQQALQQLETARIEANKQVRYLAVGVKPTPPDEPTYPRKFENTLLAFLIFAGIYLMISLTASILREQVSA